MSNDNPFINVHRTTAAPLQKAKSKVVGTNSGRPKKPGVKKYTISLPILLRDKMAKIAMDKGIDLSTLFTLLRYHYLSNQHIVLD